MGLLFNKPENEVGATWPAIVIGMRDAQYESSCIS